MPTLPELRKALNAHLQALQAHGAKCLNPFEIRGGLKPIVRTMSSGSLGLNPFEIRGGLKRLLLALTFHPEQVLIPLKSGVA